MADGGLFTITSSRISRRLRLSSRLTVRRNGSPRYSVLRHSLQLTALFGRRLVVTAQGAFFKALIKVILKHVAAVIPTLLVGAVGKRQAERQEVAGDRAHRLVVPEIKGMAALFATNLAFALPLVLLVFKAVILIMGDRISLVGVSPV